MTESADVIVMGASAGGLEALRFLITDLPESLRTPIAVVLHLPEHSEIRFSALFPSRTYQVREAVDKLKAEPSHLYFAPPGYHLLIEKNFTLSLSQDDPVNYSRPSIDVLFESAAQACGKRLIGILLTGANQDGAEGLFAIHQAGGKTIVQDPKTAQVPTMPEAAMSLFQPDHVLSLEKIRQFLHSTHPKELEWKT